MSGEKERIIPIKSQILSQMGYVLMNEIPEHKWPIGEPERVAKLCFDVDVEGYHLEVMRGRDGGKATEDSGFYIEIHQGDQVLEFSTYFFVAGKEGSDEPDDVFMVNGANFHSLTYEQSLRLCTTGIRQLCLYLESMFKRFDRVKKEYDEDDES